MHISSQILPVLGQKSQFLQHLVCIVFLCGAWDQVGQNCQKGTFLFAQLFPVVARTWLESRSEVFLPEIWDFGLKILFCHRTPNFVNGPFVALGKPVYFAPWDQFVYFSFPNYGRFRKKKKTWLTRQKSLPPPHCEGTVCQ